MTPDEHATAAVGAHAPATARSLTLEHVSVTYPGGTRALRDISLSIAPGEMVSVVGLSGSGKSTLIRTINGLVPATSGRVLVGEQVVGGLSGRGLRELRGGIGMIFQGFNLAERTSVLSNVRVGRFAHSPTWRTLLGIASTEDTRIITEALDSVGMLERAWSRAGALSGGQKQRVAIARALAQQPSVMLADEPVASLDPPTAHSVMGDLLRINQERGLTVLVNLHLMDLARQYTTRMIGLRDGELVFDGPAAGATDTDFETIYGRSIQRRDVLGSAS
ncbi:MAG: phosphonate ABC transporter ATP-binding protein [Brachybacterium sp.]|uniref:phosphonate ABC transporter ATP-binding protein n=1 Tax=Brachybacterium sp. TaxID=1891286 RepID=UPI00264D2719|nr:phosphonate ABC transporter ATP-binding protein [Brachybacterium sp.]MDN6302618.1 phosphonate ABC transporter ATP-binding protein [Brachybacterium sp.]MDN6329942.1 phosphonate ABC transporter ATP-binding protein [Brachybacterium sp.]MDN6400146.1 phosphonate ABC transporter ATP-binding protein [Brachybacterium sp.]